ncbi:MAG: 4Fe-4S dicluster domain-containing protein [Candidatus Odinarchaeota archaeon]
MMKEQEKENLEKLLGEGISRRSAKKAVTLASSYDEILEIARDLEDKEKFSVKLLEQAELPKKRMNLARTVSKKYNYDFQLASWGLRRALVSERWNSVPHPKKLKEALISKLKEVLEIIKPCYQCGRCASLCPVFTENEMKNPRLIVDKILYGDPEEVLRSDLFWYCSYCLTCSHVCPQGVDLAHALVELKNMAVEIGNVPESVLTSARLLFEQGYVIDNSRMIQKRREKLGLPELLEPDAQEIRKIVETTISKDKLDRVAKGKQGPDR